MKYRFFLPVLCLILLGGCKIGPNYKRPDYNLGKNYRFVSVADSVSFADTSWSYLFTDTILQNLINKGLRQNFDLIIAFEKINEARAAFKVTRADLYPSISAGGIAGYYNEPSPTGGTMKYNNLAATGTLSWELDIWGKLRRAKEAARAQLMAQEAYAKSVRISLIAEIASGYYSLLEFQDELQITRENVRIRQEALELVKYKLVAGTVSGLVVAQAEAELAMIKGKIPALEEVVGKQENALRLLVGELPGPVSVGDSIINQINTAIDPKTGLPTSLIFRRPDILMAEQGLVAANANVGVARGMMMPTLSINVTAGYSTLGTGWIASAIGNLLAPVFSFNKLRSNVHKSMAVKAQMLGTYQKTIYNALQEVSNGAITYDKQKVVVEENKNLYKAARTAFDLSNQLFNAGYASYLDVLDAQRTLYQAQIQLSQSQKDQLLSVVNLYLALGGGWR